VGILLLLSILYIDFKGIWIPRWSIKDRNEIFEHLEGEFNHIFLQIFALGEAYYPSEYTTSKVQSGKWLKDFLEEAHLRNIKVSAWINVFYCWGYAARTVNPTHSINRNPNWYVHDRTGRSILDYSVDELKKLGAEGYYLSPANHQVRSYITNIAAEIIDNYDFDGIHLDYIRYPGSEFIYDVSARSKFMRKYYIDPNDILMKTTLKRKLSLWGFDDITQRWRNFVCDDLTLFVKELSEQLKRKEPGLQISVAVKPNYVTARSQYYQDWTTWLNSGFVDFVCLMAYGKHIRKNLNSVLEAIDKPHKVVVGLGLYALSPWEIKKQIALIRPKPFSGIVFFSYDQLKENKEYLHSLR